MSAYTIEKIDKDFDGLVFIEDKPVKVPFSMQGELVDINKIDTTNAVGVATGYKILEFSKERIAPICPYFTKCGGCKAQHLPQEIDLKQKITNLIHLLDVNGINYPPIELIHHYGDKVGHRRRVILSVDNKKLGFKAYRSNNIIDIAKCPIATDNINKTITTLKDIVAKFNHNLKISEITLSDINGNIDVLIKSKSKINRDVIEAMQVAFVQPSIKKITWNSEILITKEEINLQYGKYSIPFSSGGFLQAEKFGEDVLINFVQSNLQNSTKVLDLFCGFGSYTFSLISNKDIAKIHSADLSATAIKSMQKYASQQLKPEVRDLFKNPFSSDFINNFDGVIINPPRAGALAQMQEIAKSDINELIMIYCSATTAVRDIVAMQKYSQLELKKIQVLDQFIYSPHIEVMIYFAKK
ncbi:MAG: methyltransferase [Alphaproteobacteria bacterium]|nr:methyltransferase [Alphaproteobacteria bacterium]